VSCFCGSSFRAKHGWLLDPGTLPGLSVRSGLVWVAFVLNGQSLFLLFLVVFITLTGS
jgi:hypothetical protein